MTMGDAGPPMMVAGGASSGDKASPSHARSTDRALLVVRQS
jgi:hypothetical protein